MKDVDAVGAQGMHGGGAARTSERAGLVPTGRLQINAVMIS